MGQMSDHRLNGVGFSAFSIVYYLGIPDAVRRLFTLGVNKKAQTLPYMQKWEDALFIVKSMLLFWHMVENMPSDSII